MSFFQKSKIDLKKHYIITYSASACDIREPYLYALVWLWRRGHVQTIMQWFSRSPKIRRRMVQKLGRLFLENLGSLFWGMFLIFGFSDFIDFIYF
jgi:hypothetical protein